MDLSSFKCPKCDYTHINLDSLRIHWSKKHKLQSIELRVLLFHDGVRPKCVCGCSEETHFKTLQLGFNEYVKGHNARVHNGWGHNKEALKKSQDVRRGMWERGEIKAWRKGLSPDDPRNKALIEKMSKTIRSNPESLRKRSECMKNQWITSSIIALTGSAHSQWKGGTSALQPIVRSHLHSIWVYPKLKASNFTCECCDSKSDLEVHHNGERFANILQKAIITLGETNDDFEKKTAIAEWVAKYHVDNDVSGIVLCERCHNKQHAKFAAGVGVEPTIA